METHRLIKFLAVTVTCLALLLGARSQAQTNVNWLSSTNMTVGTVGSLDYVLYFHWNGVKYVYNRQPAYDFIGFFTNTPAGQTLWNFVTNDRTNLATETSQRLTDRTNTLVNATNLANAAKAVTAATGQDLTNNLNAEISARTALAGTVQTVATSTTNNLLSASNALAVAIANVQTQAGGAVANGGPAALTTVTASTMTATNLATPTVSANSVSITGEGVTFPIDCSLGNNQTIYVTNASAGWHLGFYPTNFTDGTQVSVVVTAKNNLYLTISGIQTGYKLRGITPGSWTSTASTIGTISFTFVRTNVFASYGVF